MNIVISTSTLDILIMMSSSSTITGINYILITHLSFNHASIISYQYDTFILIFMYSNTNNHCGFQYWSYNRLITVELYIMYSSDMCDCYYYYIDIQKEINKIKSL